MPSRFCHRSVARVAAGVTWKSRTMTAPWAARDSHASVIDADGAIYVLGGRGSAYYNDVWVSTDKGRRRFILRARTHTPRGTVAAPSVLGPHWSSVGRPCGRRCDLDEPHDQRAVGCAIWAQERHRRRRRHLRPRRLRRHKLQGRVGEHRRRCGPDSKDTYGYAQALKGPSRGSYGFSKGHLCLF